MKQFLFLSSLIFAYNQLYGQEEMEIPIIAYWNKHDTLKYKITKVDKRTSNSELLKYDSITYNATLIVTDSTRNSYSVKWLMNGYYSTDSLMSTIDAKSLQKFNIQEIHYKTNELGEFIEITNWKDISKLMKAMFKELAKNQTFLDEVNKNKFETTMKSVSQLYSSKDNIENNVLPEIQSLHFPFGYQLSTSEVMEGEGLINSFFSDEMMRANEKVYLRQLDVEDEYCTFVYELKVNPDDAKREIRKYFKILNTDKSVEEGLNTFNLQIDDYNVFNLYYYPGIITKSDLNRFVKVEGNNVIQESHKRLIIELISK